jgi:hypothetical protein
MYILLKSLFMKDEYNPSSGEKQQLFSLINTFINVCETTYCPNSSGAASLQPVSASATYSLPPSGTSLSGSSSNTSVNVPSQEPRDVNIAPVGSVLTSERRFSVRRNRLHR